MDYPKIDRRSSRDLICEIKKMAKYYTPEWKWIDDKPDIGGALVYAYAHMFEQTLDRLNRSARNYFYEFLNSFGADIRPPMQEKGMVCFKVSEGGSGSFLPERFKLIGHSGGDDIVFETAGPVFVTESKLVDIFYTDDRADEILRIYDGADFTETCVNLQSHSIEITHGFGLFIGRNAVINLCFADAYGRPPEPAQLDELRDLSKYLWQYKIGEDLFEFGNVERNGSQLSLSGFENGFIRNNAVSISIKVTLKNGIPPLSVKADRVVLGTENSDIVPDAVFSPLKQEDAEGFYPFGERFGLYDEVLIACSEAFGKKNARVEIDFYLKYDEFEIENPDNDPKEIEWKYIMKKSELRDLPRYDITIAEEIWEYWNGNGFCALEVSIRNVFSFTGDLDYSHKKLSFVCPPDIQPVLINSIEGHFIRVRILKVNNLYRTRGRFIAPYIRKLRIAYQYSGPVPGSDVLTFNNAEMQSLNETERLFFGMGHENPVLYLRFDLPLAGSPINLLLRSKTGDAVNLFALGAQLYNGKWSELDCSYSEGDGITSFNIREAMRELTLFGVSGYWLRCEHKISERNVIFRLNTIHINTVAVIQRESFEYQYFRPDETNTVKLKKNISEIKLWVEEKDGEYEEWQRVSDFTLSAFGDRHYTVDPINGTVSFGDGIKGKLPPNKNRDNVRVLYSVGGGLRPVPKGGIDTLFSASGFINAVESLGTTNGGAEPEPAEEAAIRQTRFFKHRDRAVTPRDYEALAYEASRDVIKAKCFPNINRFAERESGCITLVLLEKNVTESGSSGIFPSIKNRVEEYIGERASLFKKLYVIEPAYIRLDLRIRVFMQSGINIYSIKTGIGKTIENYLHEISAFDDWDIGRLPTVNEINIRLRSIRDISGVRSIDIGYSHKTGGDWLYVDFWSFKQLVFAWAVKAGIEITAE